MAVFPDFVGGTYEAQSLDADAQECINLYPELIESGSGRNKFRYQGTPGKHVFGTLPTAPVRGLWAGNNRLFAAGGTKLYEVNLTTGVGTELGTIADDAAHTPVEMFPNGTQLYVVASDKGYLADGVTVTQVTTARTGALLDTFFIANPPDTKNIVISASNDGTAWDAGDIASKEGYPDYIASIFADHEELYLFGTETSEVWRNEGATPVPFVRDPGAFLHLGIVGAFSRVRLETSVFLLAGDARGQIMAIQLVGFQPKRVSTHAIEQKWATYSVVSDATAYAYVENGHSFWVINFPTADATWVYDATTGMWHKRCYWNGSVLARDRGRCHAFVAGKHFVGDHTTGIIYEQKSTFYDDFGGDIQRVRRAPYIYQEEMRVAHHRFQLDLETGGGTLACDLNWSDDKGHNYNTAKTRSAASTEYNKRLVWWRLGESRHRIYQAKITSQQKVAITNATLEVTPSTN